MTSEKRIKLGITHVWNFSIFPPDIFLGVLDLVTAQSLNTENILINRFEFQRMILTSSQTNFLPNLRSSVVLLEKLVEKLITFSCLCTSNKRFWRDGSNHIFLSIEYCTTLHTFLLDLFIRLRYDELRRCFVFVPRFYNWPGKCYKTYVTIVFCG